MIYLSLFETSGVQSSMSGDYAFHGHGNGPRDGDEDISVSDYQRTNSLGSWEEILKNCSRGYDNVPSQGSIGVSIQGENGIQSDFSAGVIKENYGSALPVQSNFQVLPNPFLYLFLD